MKKILVVTSGFGSFQAGDRITDASQVDAFMASHPAHVVPVMVVDEPPAAPAPAPVAPPADDHYE